MNDTDLRTIRNRFLGGRKLLGTLATLSAVYQHGQVTIAEYPMPLTTAQKNGVKAQFDAIADKLEAGVDSIGEPTGKVGVIDQTILNHIQEAPARIAGYFNSYLEEIVKFLDVEPAEVDGVWTVPYPDNTAQEFANKLATLAAGVKFAVSVERLKVG